MRPHEQAWRKDERRAGVIRVSDHLCLEVRADLSAMLMDSDAVSRDVRDVVTLAIAAPAMARALLEVREALSTNTLCSEGAHEMCERVLKQAGVLP